MATTVYDVAKASAVTALATAVDGAVADASEALSVANSFAADIEQVSSRLTGIINVADYATPGQLNGTEDAAPAWLAAIDAVRIMGGGTIMSPPDAQWWWSGVGIAYLSTQSKEPIHDVVFDGQGCKMFKTTQDGNYVMFLDRYSNLPLDWGSGSTNITFQNFNVYGSFDEAQPASVCLFAGNHTKKLRVRNCHFYQTMAGGHTFDLAGVQDAVFEQCTWYGYMTTQASGSAPRGEAINTDNSLNGSGAAAAGWASGLSCRDITLRDSQFFGWTDPVTGTKWPAPNPIGGHGASEGQPFKNIVVDNVLVVDPPKDNASTGVGGDNPYIRGVFHWTAVEGLKIRARVVATDGLGCVRVVQVQSSSEGNVAGSADNPVVGPFASPMQAKGIDIDLEVEGFGGSDSALNPLVVISGLTTQNARGINVRLKADNYIREGVYLIRCEGGTVDLVDCTGNTAGSGARLNTCKHLTVRGNVKTVDFPVRVEGSQHIGVGPLTAFSSVAKNTVIRTDALSNFISYSGLSTKGYAAVFNITPANNGQNVVVP